MTESVPENDQHHQFTPRNVAYALLLFVGFVTLFYDVIIHTFSKWFTSEGSHWSLILGASLYIIWLKRDDFKYLPQNPNLLVGSLLTAVGCFLLFAGKLSYSIVAQQLAVIPVLLGTVLLVRGFGWFKALFIPICYLIFQTGLPEWFLGQFSIYFQKSAAWLATMFIGVSGMPVIRSGTIIDLPHIALEVVRECSGVSNIVALMALSIFLGFVLQLSVYKKALLVFLSVPVGVFANGVRIALIGFYAVYNKGADIHGPYETMGMSLIFFFGMLILVLIGHLIKNKKIVTGQGDDSVVDTEITHCSEPTVAQQGRRRFQIAGLILGGLIITTVAMVHLYKIRPVYLQEPLASFPMMIGDLTGEDFDWVDERIRPFAADDNLIRIFRDSSSGQQHFVYIGYFNEQDRDVKIIDYRRGWMHMAAQQIAVSTSDGAVTINQSRLRDNFIPSDIYFWYVMDDHIITNQHVGKLYTFFDGLFKRRTNGAVVVVQTRSSQEVVMPFLAELVPEVMGHLGAGE